VQQEPKKPERTGPPPYDWAKDPDRPFWEDETRWGCSPRLFLALWIIVFVGTCIATLIVALAWSARPF